MRGDGGVMPELIHAHSKPHNQGTNLLLKSGAALNPMLQEKIPDKPGKKIKYEHPPKTDLSIFLLDVPDAVCDRIYEKHKVNPTSRNATVVFGIVFTNIIYPSPLQREPRKPLAF